MAPDRVSHRDQFLGSGRVNPDRAVETFLGQPGFYRNGEAPAGIHALCDIKGMVAERYDARDGSAYLIRPDQHIAARMREASVEKIHQAVARATAQH